MLNRVRFRNTLIALACALSISAHAMADGLKVIDVPAGELTGALEKLAVQSGVEFIYSADSLKGLQTEGLHGMYEAKEAIRLLIKGTGLEASEEPNGAILIALPRQKGRSDGSHTEPRQRGETDPGSFRSPEGNPGKASSDASVEKNSESTSRTKPIQLEEVLVTGSRIPALAGQGAQEVQRYDRKQIEQSGQTSVADFLSTLPDVSVAVSEQNQGFIASSGVTSVQLHGLPVGSTLVLINGHRVETSGVTQGGTGNFFDLSSIPLSAVKRIEVVPVGSSAIYGSDAIAGVVNIILRNDLDGIETSVKYGRAADTGEGDANFALGRQYSGGGFSIIGSVQTRSELQGGDRPLTANNDYRAYGGQDERIAECNPGNVYSVDGNPLPGLGSATFAAVPPGFTGAPTQAEFSKTAGTQNLCSSEAATSLIPSARRQGLFASGSYKPGSFEFFAEALVSHQDATAYESYPGLFAVPGFALFTAAATNPFNPFGVPVGVGTSFTSLGRAYLENDETFIRPLLGVRGHLGSAWDWELVAWDSQDHSHVRFGNFLNSALARAALGSSDPSTALDPFTSGPQGSPALLHSLVSDVRIDSSGKTDAINGYLHGPIIDLPAGQLQGVLGSEFDRDELRQDAINFPGLPANKTTDFSRRRYALFGEARIPLWATQADQRAREVLSLNVAARYDHYNDFGSKATPQFGAEWSPFRELLFRGTYAKAFRAPPLPDLDAASFSGTGEIIDPLRGNQAETVTTVEGANPNLAPETGTSSTLGVQYTSSQIPELQLTLTQWRVREQNSIQFLSAQTIVDNESLFPGHVIRAPGSNGQPGPITEVFATNENFGQIDVAGVDLQIRYSYASRLGTFSPQLSFTRTYRYTAALTPQTPAINKLSAANDDLNWAPRWKGLALLGWSAGPVVASFAGRYVGSYRDYDSTQVIGNFWVVDANLRWNLGRTLASGDGVLAHSYFEVGAINLFDRSPQFSNFGFGGVGFDPLEADIRGRFVYAQVGLAL